MSFGRSLPFGSEKRKKLQNARRFRLPPLGLRIISLKSSQKLADFPFGLDGLHKIFLRRNDLTMPINQPTNKSYFVEEKVDVIYVTGTDLVIDDADFPGAKDVFIRGDAIQLRGQIRLPGRSVRIFARILSVAAGTTIDVSGDDQSFAYPRANNGGSAGARGQDGAVGRPGQAGGKIVLLAGTFVGKLTLKANGGKGGKGQDGGHGAQGNNGPNGRTNTARRVGFNPGERGGDGQAGGPGGNGGNGGPGGAAGEISVKTIGPIQPGSIIIEAVRGLGGVGGANGTGGPGGEGGIGGEGTDCIFEGGRP